MFEIKAVGFGVVLPAVIASQILLLALPARRWSKGLACLAGPVAMAAAFCAGYFALDLGPLWPAKTGRGWLPHLTLLAIPAGWIWARFPGRDFSLVALAVFCYAATVPIVPAWASKDLPDGLWTLVLGTITLCVAALLLHVSTKLPSATLAAMLGAASAGAGALLALASVSSLAQLAGVLFGIAMVLAALAHWVKLDPEGDLLQGVIPGFIVLYTYLIFTGFQNSFSKTPWDSYLLAALAPAAPAIALWPAVQRLEGRSRFAVIACATLVPVACALIRSLS